MDLLIDHHTYQHALKHFEKVAKQYIESSNNKLPLIDLFRFYVIEVFKADPINKSKGRDIDAISYAKHCIRHMLVKYTDIPRYQIGVATCLKDHSGVTMSLGAHYRLMKGNQSYAEKCNLVEDKIKAYLNENELSV